MTGWDTWSADKEAAIAAAEARGEARGYARGVKDAAAWLDCGCPARVDVLACVSTNSGDRWRACGRDPCRALEAAAIRALIPAERTDTRPMSEAPRDGTKVLAWWPALPHDADTGAWATTWFEVNAGGLKQWHTPWEEAFDGDDDAPTHFLPHPPHGA